MVRRLLMDASEPFAGENLAAIESRRVQGDAGRSLRLPNPAAMETAPRIQRFSPQTATPAQAYDRGTRTPREVRQLGETLLAWQLSNLTHDCLSPYGDLPRRFGFACERGAAAPLREAPYYIALTPVTRLFALETRIVCSHGSGSVLLSANRFDFQQTGAIPTLPAARLPDRGGSPLSPQHWVLGWACLARTFSLFARYERWVMETFGERYRYDCDAQRPRAARRSAVPLLQLSAALDSMAEWCGDGERAMLTWVVSDARERCIMPDIPRI